MERKAMGDGWAAYAPQSCTARQSHVWLPGEQERATAARSGDDGAGASAQCINQGKARAAGWVVMIPITWTPRDEREDAIWM